MDLGDELSRYILQSFLDFQCAKAQNLQLMEGGQDCLDFFQMVIKFYVISIWVNEAYTSTKVMDM
jgi:hypothetical protein